MSNRTKDSTSKSLLLGHGFFPQCSGNSINGELLAFKVVVKRYLFEAQSDLQKSLKITPGQRVHFAMDLLLRPVAVNLDFSGTYVAHKYRLTPLLKAVNSGIFPGLV